MLLVELPLFARSGLGVGIAINTIMSSGSILSRRPVFFSVTTLGSSQEGEGQVVIVIIISFS